MRFAQSYCAISEIEQIQPHGYDAFENLDQLRGHLNRLVQLYTNRDSLLNNTILHAKEHYRGMHTIRTSGIIIAADVEQRLECQSPSHITWLEIEETIWGRGPLGIPFTLGFQKTKSLPGSL